MILRLHTYDLWCSGYTPMTYATQATYLWPMLLRHTFDLCYSGYIPLTYATQATYLWPMILRLHTFWPMVLRLRTFHLCYSGYIPLSHRSSWRTKSGTLSPQRGRLLVDPQRWGWTAAPGPAQQRLVLRVRACDAATTTLHPWRARTRRPTVLGMDSSTW